MRVDIFDCDMNFLVTIQSHYETDKLVELMQYNGYTVQLLDEKGTVIDTVIGK